MHRIQVFGYVPSVDSISTHATFLMKPSLTRHVDCSTPLPVPSRLYPLVVALVVDLVEL